MSELDLLNLARSSLQTINSDLAQVITVTFAMIVAIYYFLHQAGIRMKLFAFAIYTCGMLLYLGMMVLESYVGSGAQKQLANIPVTDQTTATQMFLAIRTSWIGTFSTILINTVYWILWAGTGYLLFFWRKPAELSPR